MKCNSDSGTTLALILATALGLGLLSDRATAKTIPVSINTTAWVGQNGALLVEFNTGRSSIDFSTVYSSEYAGQSDVYTLSNVVHDGVMGTHQTYGGLVNGPLMWRANPAGSTKLDVDLWRSRDGLFEFYDRAPHTLFIVSFREPGFGAVAPRVGTYLNFDLVLDDTPQLGTELQDAFVVSWVDALGRRIATSDPWGSDALVVIETPLPYGNGPSQTKWVVSAFAPAIFTEGQGQNPDVINIVLSAPPDMVAPSAVGDLGVVWGKTNAAISWTAPGDDGSVGQAQGFDLRYSLSPITGEQSYGAAAQVNDEPIPGASGAAHCMEIEPLISCQTYYFAIKTVDESGNWSALSNIASGMTMCSGFQFAFCDGGGLMAGGGDGGEEGSSAMELASAQANLRPEGSPNENSLLWWDGGGLEITDLQRIATGAGPEASYPVTVREVERRQTHLDQIRLGAIDHVPTRLALAGAGQAVVGTPGAALSVEGSDGLVRISRETPYVARSGEVLEVELGPLRADRALVLETRRRLTGAKTDSLGIRVERQLPDGSWAGAAVVHPRREFDKFAIPAQGSPAMRITFLGSYPIRAVEALEDIEVVMPTVLTLSDAAHSRLGVVSPAVRDSGDTKTTLVPGDSLMLEFAATEIPAGMVRSLFLTAKGSCERLDGAEVHDIEAVRAVVNEPILEFSLGAAFPNPSDGTVTIGYTLPRQVPIVLRVYNVAGREVRTLVDQEQTAGRREALWDGHDNGGRRVSSGVYFYRLQAGPWRSERKLIVLQR